MSSFGTLLVTGVGALGIVLTVDVKFVVSIGKSKLFWLMVFVVKSFSCLVDGGGAGACFLLFCLGLVELELLFSIFSY